jgi:hypothetical protein
MRAALHSPEKFHGCFTDWNAVRFRPAVNITQGSAQSAAQCRRTDSVLCIAHRLTFSAPSWRHAERGSDGEKRCPFGATQDPARSPRAPRLLSFCSVQAHRARRENCMRGVDVFEAPWTSLRATRGGASARGSIRALPGAHLSSGNRGGSPDVSSSSPLTATHACVRCAAFYGVRGVRHLPPCFNVPTRPRRLAGRCMRIALLEPDQSVRRDVGRRSPPCRARPLREHHIDMSTEGLVMTHRHARTPAAKHKSTGHSVPSDSGCSLELPNINHKCVRGYPCGRSFPPTQWPSGSACAGGRRNMLVSGRIPRRPTLTIQYAQQTGPAICRTGRRRHS